jgi:hypothetical protein
VLLRTRVAFSLPSGGALNRESGPQDIRLRPRLSKLLVHLFVRPREVALLNKLVFENLRQRPVRTCLSVLAIGVEVTMILTLVGISYGTLDETARRARGVGADILVRPPSSSIISI